MAGGGFAALLALVPYVVNAELSWRAIALVDEAVAVSAGEYNQGQVHGTIGSLGASF